MTTGRRSTRVLDPSTASRVAAGTDAGFMREVITDMERTRRFLLRGLHRFTISRVRTVPCGSMGCARRRGCSLASVRPIRAPRISVTGLNKLTGCTDVNDPSTCTNSTVEADVEVFTIEFTVYEPGINTCEAGWYDAANDVWYFDQGSSYVLSASRWRTTRLRPHQRRGPRLLCGGSRARRAAEPRGRLRRRRVWPAARVPSNKPRSQRLRAAGGRDLHDPAQHERDRGSGGRRLGTRPDHRALTRDGVEAHGGGRGGVPLRSSTA